MQNCAHVHVFLGRGMSHIRLPHRTLASHHALFSHCPAYVGSIRASVVFFGGRGEMALSIEHPIRRQRSKAEAGPQGSPGPASRPLPAHCSLLTAQPLIQQQQGRFLLSCRAAQG